MSFVLEDKPIKWRLTPKTWVTPELLVERGIWTFACDTHSSTVLSEGA